MITDILAELGSNSSKNFKLDILKKNKDNDVLKTILAMTYDKVTYTYGITMKNIKYTPEAIYAEGLGISLVEALTFLKEKLCTRELTGNKAHSTLEAILESLPKEDAKLIGLILGRDLKVGIGRTMINKVFKDLIIKPPYMRCGIYSTKTAKNITFPAFVQEKCDGRYVAVIVESGAITFQSRSGEEQEFPELRLQFKHVEPGVYIGELLVKGETNRALANGMINSSTPPHDRIYIQLWDFINLEEWSRPKDKENKTIYGQRFRELRNNIKDTSLELVETHAVKDLTEAEAFTRKMMTDGKEGSILKDRNNIFVDHTSTTQLKLKVSFEVDVIITGFTDGTKGTKREGKVGAITFTTAPDKTGNFISGQTSGFSDEQMEYFTKHQDSLIGDIMTVQANDITKSRDKDDWALSHPRFIELRPDKKIADTFLRAMEQLQSGKNLK